MPWTPTPYNPSIIDLAQQYAKLEATITSILGYKPTTAEIEAFPFDIYKFVILALRTFDQDSSVGGTKLLQRFLKGPNDIFYLMWNKAETLKTLFDPAVVDTRYLKPLRELVGFGDDIPGIASACNEEELRRLIVGATLFWKYRWVNKGLQSAVRLTTGNRFKIRNYFDFRFVIGEQMILEELQDEDPYLLTHKTLESFLTGADGAATIGGDPYVFGTPGPSQFASEHIGAYVYIYDDTGSPSCNGIYEITAYNPISTYVTVNKPFPATRGSLKYIIAWEYNEFLTEIRVVDEVFGKLGSVNTSNPNYFNGGGSYSFSSADVGKYLRIKNSDNDQNGWWKINGYAGGGTYATLEKAQFTVNESALSWGLGSYSINRGLLEKLLEEQRLGSERINVVYIDFMDLFNVPGDTSQWADGGLDPYNLTVADGVATLSSQNTSIGTSAIVSNNDLSSSWGDYSWKNKITMTETGRFFLLFNLTDVDNCLYFEIEYTSGIGTATIKLYENLAGSPTLKNSTTFPAFELDSSWTYTIETYYDTSTTTEISTTTENVVLKIDGIEFVNISFSTTFTSGKIGYLVADNCEIQIDETELWQYPLTIDRVGPNP